MHSNQILSDDKEPQVLLVDGPKMCPMAVILQLEYPAVLSRASAGGGRLGLRHIFLSRTDRNVTT